MEITRIEPFLDYFERVRERTLRAALAIPPERMEWTHRPGAFTFGDLVRHLGATERWMFAENASLRPSRYPGHEPSVAAGYPGPVAYLEAMHAAAMEIFRGLSPDDLRRRCETPGGAPIPVWKWLRSMVEHEIHHRGQIHLMLTMAGAASPPLYGLTAEEVHARSLPMDPAPAP